jgi:hypothetical protein
MIADLVGLSHPVNAALAVSFHRSPLMMASGLKRDRLSGVSISADMISGFSRGNAGHLATAA